MSTAYLVSCPNATCTVPTAYRDAFPGAEETLASSEGWEPGTLNIAQGFAMRLRTPLVHGDVTRLLIDLEQDGEQRWSRFSRKLPESIRAKIAERHAAKYYDTLRRRIAIEVARCAQIVHLMIHTSPETDGVRLTTGQDETLAAEIATRWRSLLVNAGITATTHVEPTSVLQAAITPEETSGKLRAIRFTAGQSFFLAGKPLRWETFKKLTLDTFVQAMSAN
ncbi:MAG: hypothetical protein V4733_10230 [Verrucomicrobiota bacterium]